MSSTENNLQEDLSTGLQIPGLVQNSDLGEQLSFPDNPTTPYPENLSDLADAETAPQVARKAGGTLPLSPPPPSSPGSTSAFLLNAQPTMTQALSEAISHANTGPLRKPLVIKGSNKPKRSVRPPQGRRHVIGIASLALLVVITVGAFFAASPMGREIGLTFGMSTPGSSMVKNPGGNNMDLMAQQATATAIVHQQTDGYVPGSTGGAIVTGSPETWPYGVCTYWANYRYHQLTGVWVTWLGNAYAWADGAGAAGWTVSSTPHVPSIIVLQPGVQGASGYGHVGVVESIVDSTTVSVSNMNWYTNGGGYGIVSYVDFHTGPGVLFIWK